MRLFLSICLILYSCTCYAQITKAPISYVDLDRAEITEDGPRIQRGVVTKQQVVNNHLKGYCETVWKINDQGTFDSTEVYFYTYYPNGLLHAVDKYMVYEDDEYPGFSSKLSDGSSMEYSYDGNANPLTKTTYQVTAPNTKEAYFYQLSKASSGSHNNTMSDEEFHDSLKETLLHAEIPGSASLFSTEYYTYDKRNYLTAVTSKKQNNRISYTYGERKGQVQWQRRVQATFDGRYVHTLEEHFTYTPQQLIATHTKYMMAGDSAKIDNDSFKASVYALTYDYEGNPVTLKETRYAGGKMQMQLLNQYQYEDGLRTSDLTLTNDTDTVSFTTYKYDKGLLVEETNYYYKDRERKSGRRIVTTRNEDGLPVTAKNYWLGDSREVLTMINRYVYE